MDIRAAIKVEFSAVDGKRNAFCLGLPWRTFYFVGKSAGDTESWMRFFQGRIVSTRFQSVNDGLHKINTFIFQYNINFKIFIFTRISNNL